MANVISKKKSIYSPPGWVNLGNKLVYANNAKPISWHRQYVKKLPENIVLVLLPIQFQSSWKDITSRKMNWMIFRVQLYIISKYYLFLMIKFSICVLIWYIPDFPHYKANISLPLLRIQMLIKDWIAFECFKDINYIAMLTKCILGIIFASSWRSKETIIILHNTNEKK